MDQPGSSQPQSQPPPRTSISAAENPVEAVVAAGRKVKSIFVSKNQPSVRILRGRSATGQPRREDVSQNDGEKPLPPLPPPGNQQVPEQHVRSNQNAGTGVFRSIFSRKEQHTDTDKAFEGECYDCDTVDLLDVVDPEVSTLSTLTNVQNSLFVPSMGRVFNRRPTYRISESDGEVGTLDKLKASLKRIASQGEGEEDEKGESRILGPRPKRKPVPPLSNAKYAVLPDGEMLEGWNQAEKEELDDLVRHQLHSRRAKFKRAMKGFGQYVRRPLGLFITVYATLITLFGAAWVFFLIGWISLGSKESYIINIVDNVLVALFAIIGDGLAPFRAVDTYHMAFIAHYHRKTWKRREQLGLPELVDHNDLPDQRKEEVEPRQVDLESLVARRMPRRLARVVSPRIPKRLAQRILTRNGTQDPGYEYTVLSDKELERLEYHERKFSKSHTFYKPHETETHFAFPLKLLVAIVVLLDCHSALQISLGACTWGISYKTRPFALTTVILCCSITCNIMGGVLISVGDKRTRKKDVIERMMRQELTADAIETMQKRWLKEAEERGEIDPSVRKRAEKEKEEKENEDIKKSWKVVPALPKHLLGKGEDHRQPSLPQKARQSNSSIPSTASSPTAKKSKSGSSGVLQPVQEGPTHPEPALTRHDDESKEGLGRKTMRLIRRADLDRS